jgi:hypothetical protein
VPGVALEEPPGVTLGYLTRANGAPVATVICRSNRDANQGVSNLQEVTGPKALCARLLALLNDTLRSGDDNSRHATLVVLRMSVTS